MRILMITNYFLYPSSNGGANMSRWIARGLAEKGHSVEVVCLTHGPRDSDFHSRMTEQDGIKVNALTPKERPPGRSRPLWRIRPDGDMQKAAIKILKRVRPDLVYMHGGLEIGEFSRVASHDLDLPTIFHVHCFAHLCARQFLYTPDFLPCEGPVSLEKCFECLQKDFASPRRKLQFLCSHELGRRLLGQIMPPARLSSFRLYESLHESFAFLADLRRSVDCWIMTSKTIAKIHEPYGVSSQQAHILPHFLPADRTAKSVHTDSKDGKVRLGYFGRISPEKGTETLVSALKLLSPNAKEKFHLVIVTNVDSTALQKQIMEEAGLLENQVQTVVGRQGAALNPILADLDLCIIPSVCYEIGPLTFLECVAQGTPCVVSDVIGHAFMIRDGFNGRKFRAGNALDLSRMLGELIHAPATLAQWRTRQATLQGPAQYFDSLEKILTAGRLGKKAKRPAVPTSIECL